MKHYTMTLKPKTKTGQRKTIKVTVYYKDEQPPFLQVWSEVWEQVEKSIGKLQYMEILKIEGDKPIRAY